MTKTYEQQLRTWTYCEEKFRGRVSAKPLPTWRNEAGYRVIEDSLGSKLYGSGERKWLIVKPDGNTVRGKTERTSHKPRRFASAESAKRKVEKFAKQWEKWQRAKNIRREAAPYRMAANKARRALEDLKKLDKEYELGIDSEAFTILETRVDVNDRAADDIESKLEEA